VHAVRFSQLLSAPFLVALEAQIFVNNLRNWWSTDLPFITVALCVCFHCNTAAEYSNVGNTSRGRVVYGMFCYCLTRNL